MLVADAGWVLMGFLLSVSGAQEPPGSICALKGSSASLACSAHLPPPTLSPTLSPTPSPSPSPTSPLRWYRLYANGSVEKELAAKGNAGMEDFDLTIRNVSEGDAGGYCCSPLERHTLDECTGKTTMLQVADLQVKVLPEIKWDKVSLMCQSSCRLSEEPEAYIWYLNGDFLYEDWSHWYQQLVSSSHTLRYSCAIKGYEHLRAPEVSVDSLTKDCATVSYAGGRMCSSGQTSLGGLCSITYPTEVYATATALADSSTVVACNSSCHAANHLAPFQMYLDEEAVQGCDMQALTITQGVNSVFSCSVKGNEDLHSFEICVDQTVCSMVNYPIQRICALEGSSVWIDIKYWINGHNNLQEPDEALYKSVGGVKVFEIRSPLRRAEGQFYKMLSLQLNDLMKNDSAEYGMIRQKSEGSDDRPGVTLVVTGVEVKFSPSAVVRENQRVTLICSTSCPLPGARYRWFFNGHGDGEGDGEGEQLVSQDHFLLLDPVGLQHAGNYSCSVQTKIFVFSSQETLTVQGLERVVMMLNVAKLLVLFVVPPALWIFHLRIRTSLRTPAEPRLPCEKASPAEQEEEFVWSQL